MRGRALVVAAWVAGSVAWASNAWANGRFPSAEQLVVQPGDPNHLAVQTTYGFLQTRDGGEKWTWSCEEAAGYGGILDPPIQLFDNGRLLAGVFDGLLVSSADGCDYALQGGDLASRFFVDVSVYKNTSSRALGVASNGLGGNNFDTRLFATSDGGDTFALLGTPLPADFLALTADVAPSNEQRIYVSGFTILSSSQYVGSLAKSDNGGQSWEVLPIAGSDNTKGPYLGAIDPSNPDRLYVRLGGDSGQLLVSEDAGISFTSIFTTTSPLLGFAISPDGSQIRVGSEADGISGASASDYAFSKLSDIGARCLTFTSEALYVCAREAVSGFTIGRSTDGGSSFEAIHHLNCLSGPDPACGAETGVGSLCPARWAAQKQVLQTDTCESGTSTGAGGATGAGDGETGGGDGCCSVAGAGAPPREGHAGWWLGVLGLAVASTRRFRARLR